MRPRVIAFPTRLIDYAILLADALRSRGVDVVEGIHSGRWLAANVRRGDVVHFHWPSFYYHAPDAARTLVATLRWFAFLALIRAKGGRIVWTAHNLMPHDPAPIPGLDALVRRIVIGLGDAVFVHGVEAEKLLLARFPSARGKTVRIPHGHFIDHFRCDESVAEARHALGLRADAFVFAFVGLCKPYKGLETLIDQFRSWDGDATLLVAGKFASAAYEDAIRARAAGDARIVVRAGFIPDALLGRHFRAADVVVAPYRNVLTSGTAVMAMSFGRPIVSVALGHLLDVVTPETGILYRPDEADGLVRALDAARHRSFDAARILAHARSFSFADTARITTETLFEPDDPRRAASGHAR